MLMLDFLAEQKIAEAVSRGELDHLPGQDCPLDGGFVPAEVETLNEIAQLERLVVEDAGGDAAARAKALKKLALLRTQIESGYYEQALRKLST